MNRSYITRLEERSGQPHRTGETVREYIERLAATSGVPEDVAEDVADALDRARFQPAETLSARDEAALERFLDEVPAATKHAASDEREEPIEAEGGPTTTDVDEPVRETPALSDHEAAVPDDGRHETTDATESAAAAATAATDAGDSLHSSTAAQSALSALSALSPRSISVGSESATRGGRADPLDPRWVTPAVERAWQVVFATRQDVVAIGTLLIAGVYGYYLSLGAGDLRVWDEAIYANAARQMVQNGYWLVPHLHFWGGEVGLTPFLEKPPGMMWLQALSMLVFGPTAFAARFPSATFAILTGVLAYVVGRSMFDRRAGFVAGLAWLTTPYIFAGHNAGRQAATDTGFLFFGSLLVFLTWRSVTDDRPRDLWYAGAAAAGALLIKGFAAGVFLIVLLPLVVTNIRWFVQRAAWLGALVTVGLAAPWPIYAWFRYRDHFLDQIFFEQVLGRITAEEESEALLSFMREPYLQQTPKFFDPWLYFALAAIVVAAVTVVLAARGYGRNRSLPTPRLSLLPFPARDRRAVTALVWWAVAVFGFFSLTGNLRMYMMPAYVPGCLLVGWLASRVSRGDGIAVGGALLGTVLVGSFSPRLQLTPFADPEAFTYGLDYGRELPTGAVFGVPFVLGVALVVAVGLGIGPAARARVPSDIGRAATYLVPALLALCLVGGMLVPAGTPEPNQYGLVVNQEVPRDETVYVDSDIPDRNDFMSFSFYAQRSFEEASVTNLDGDPSIRYAMVLEEHRSSLSRPHTVVVSFPEFTTGEPDYHVAVIEFTDDTRTATDPASVSRTSTDTP